MDTTNSKKIPRAVTPLSVNRVADDLVLLFVKNYNKRQQLYLSRQKKDGHFGLAAQSISILSKRGRHQRVEITDYFQLAQIGHERILTFTENSHVVFAHHHSAAGWHASLLQHINPTKAIKGPGVLVPDYLFDGNYVLYSGTNEVRVNFSSSLKQWFSDKKAVLEPRHDLFDSGKLRPIATSRIEQGILVLYTSDISKRASQTIALGAALFAADNPQHLLWRSEVALWECTLPKRSNLKCLGVDIDSRCIQIFWRTKYQNLFSISLPNPFSFAEVSKSHTRLKRHHQNPILSPRSNDWESVGVFNPATLQDRDGRIHIMYRALNTAGISYLGYALSEDGFSIVARSSTPAYWPREEWEGTATAKQSWSENYGSGGGWGGCEDPKLTQIDDTVYLSYVAHNGDGPPRIALSKIPIEDFVAQNWHKWSRPKLISEPGVVNKSGVILPEKIAGQYVVFHRVFPNILVDMRGDLNFEEPNRWLRAKGEIPIRPSHWDSRKLSIGATPVRIRDGWLVIYHAVDDRDPSRYKIGAMILDAKDPTKVLYRTSHPILSPEAPYENDWKFGVAYPSGAAIKDGTLLVYYGGGDKFVCVASANLEKFIEDLKKDRVHTLDTSNLQIA